MKIIDTIINSIRKQIGMDTLDRFERFINENIPNCFVEFEENNDCEFCDDGETYFVAKDNSGNILKYYPDFNEWTLSTNNEDYTGFSFDEIKKYYESVTAGNLLFFPVR